MTTLTQPIAKLYKRCARNKHEDCPGSFETWSICTCQCHAGVSDMRPAPVCETCHDQPVETTINGKPECYACVVQDKADAVAAAQAIVAPTTVAKPAKARKPSDPTVNLPNIPGGHRNRNGGMAYPTSNMKPFSSGVHLADYVHFSAWEQLSADKRTADLLRPFAPAVYKPHA